MDYKTPWTLTENSWDTISVYDRDGKTVCTLRLSEEDVTEDNQDEKMDEQLKLAKLIVKAPELLADLRAARAVLFWSDEPFMDQVREIDKLLKDIE